MTTNGGGWMSFASIPASGGMFGGDTGANNWYGLSYTYGTYDSSGGIRKLLA